MNLEEVKSLIRDVKDFPKAGIVFKDITPILANAKARKLLTTLLTDQYASHGIEAVAGIEARGFLFGMALADALNVPFLPVRKAGKLPYKRLSETYDLEYGTATVEMHEDAVRNGQKILIHDDLLATGGTAAAAGRLVKRLGGEVTGFSFVISLQFLSGKKNLEQSFGAPVRSLFDF
ncbi:MAG: adenine phosphoribosyltransferase [Bacteroidetes bacterium]|nr:adenine phosphoribosyltransferase [Bacteroidota bacterium]